MKIKIPKRLKQKKIQTFDLNDDEQADRYYRILGMLSKKKIKLPILAKGTLRMVDFTDKLNKLDVFQILEQRYSRDERNLLAF